MPDNRVRKHQPARSCVAQRLKMLMVSQIHCAFSPLRGASRTRLSFPHAIVLLISMTSAVSAEELRDPTRPHTYDRVERTVDGVPSFTINAIFVSDDRRIAIVNGERVRVGDTVSGATVVSIQKEQVTLSVSGQKFTARLKTRRP